MKNCKSPGSDGITTEFYKIFWNDIKHFLKDSLNYSFRNLVLAKFKNKALLH